MSCSGSELNLCDWSKKKKTVVTPPQRSRVDSCRLLQICFKVSCASIRAKGEKCGHFISTFTPDLLYLYRKINIFSIKIYKKSTKLQYLKQPALTQLPIYSSN